MSMKNLYNSLKNPRNSQVSKIFENLLFTLVEQLNSYKSILEKYFNLTIVSKFLKKLYDAFEKI